MRVWSYLGNEKEREHDRIPWLISPHISIFSLNTPKKLEKKTKMQKQTWILSQKRMICWWAGWRLWCYCGQAPHDWLSAPLGDGSEALIGQVACCCCLTLEYS